MFSSSNRLLHSTKGKKDEQSLKSRLLAFQKRESKAAEYARATEVFRNNLSMNEQRLVFILFIHLHVL